MAKGKLRSILAGAVWTGRRLHAAGLIQSESCPHCSLGEVEDERHIWWRCPAWDTVRARHLIA
eukprot:4639800-Karenia_brevis.AAC.1